VRDKAPDSKRGVRAAQLNDESRMQDVREMLDAWGNSLCAEVSVADLLSRNRTAHKWKVTLRITIVRECICWRTHDLLNQAAILLSQGHSLGCRILLRSAFESVALLVYLNEQIRAVTRGRPDTPFSPART
jgi:hypothetical protein